MTHRTPEQIRAGFADLRIVCDPRGHELLDELENACLVDNAMLSLHDRIADIQADLAAPSGPVGQVIPFPGHSVNAS